jgi:hypothetical protein
MSKRKQVDAHHGMRQIIQRINEHNERRAELVRSGQAACHPAWFDKWEARELEQRHQFEITIMKGAT